MRRTDPPAATVKIVRERDDWRCARCAGWGPLSTQHRVARGMGGTRWPGINLPSNLLTLCGSGTTQCHGWVEAHPTWAEAHGWSVPRWAQHAVSEVPVWTWRGWVRLHDGTDEWWPAGQVELLHDHRGVPDCPCGCRPTETTAGLWTRETAR